MGLWYPNWYPKNSGCLAGTQGIDGELAGSRQREAQGHCELFEHPKVVQEMLGHASITLTLDTYSHVLPGMQEESAAQLDRLLGEQ